MSPCYKNALAVAAEVLVDTNDASSFLPTTESLVSCHAHMRRKGCSGGDDADGDGDGGTCVQYVVAVSGRLRLRAGVATTTTVVVRAAAPAESRQSFHGSALPFPSPEVALNGGAAFRATVPVDASTGRFSTVIPHVPNSFVGDPAGRELVAPSVDVIIPLDTGGSVLQRVPVAMDDGRGGEGHDARASLGMRVLRFHSYPTPEQLRAMHGNDMGGGTTPTLVSSQESLLRKRARRGDAYNLWYYQTR